MTLSEFETRMRKLPDLRVSMYAPDRRAAAKARKRNWNRYSTSAVRFQSLVKEVYDD